jgi:hypothetical protein
MEPRPVESLLAELGERLGMPGLRLDAGGACQLVFDQRWLVTLLHERSAGRLSLYCALGPAGQPEHLGTQTMADLLRANFLGQGCAGGALSFGPDGRAYLQLSLNLADAGAQDLHNRLETLLNQCETWSERLQRGEGSGQTAPAAGRPPPAWAIQRA